MSPPRNAAHDFIPNELRSTFPRLYETEDQPDPIVRVKLFTPDSNWTWYIVEWDGGDLCFGLVSGHELELGYFSLADLRGIRGGLGLPVERDLYFTPCPLSAVKQRHA